MHVFFVGLSFINLISCCGSLFNRRSLFTKHCCVVSVRCNRKKINATSTMQILFASYCNRVDDFFYELAFKNDVQKCKIKKISVNLTNKVEQTLSKCLKIYLQRHFLPKQIG